jgi:tryptophan synthase alpha chain
LSRIAGCLEQLSKSGRKALIPYIVAGDPSSDFTVPMMHELVKAGADIIELGVPFSDPMAEGPVIQLAHERALAQSVSLRQVLAMVKDFRASDNATPVVLMGYANPVECMGYEAFAEAASEAGVDGLLTVDIPPEEATEINQALKQRDMDNIFLIAPTTSEQRIKQIADLASGYVYYVSLKGVTGAGNLDIGSVEQKLEQIKSYTSLPIAVGFGIKDAESARAISALSEGVVVGSALVDNVVSQLAQGESATLAQQKAAQIIASMRSAMDSAG